MEFESVVSVPASHPSLEGHFPGRPIVPGVVTLDAVLERAERHLGRSLDVSGIAYAKFLAPLEPGLEAQATFRLASGRLEFRVHRAEQLIAQGVFTLAASPAPALGRAEPGM